MTQPDDQNNSGLRVSGYGPRVRQTLIAGIVIAAIVVAIVLAALWANSREPEMGVQPTPRPTQPPQPSATVPPPDTATPEPEEVQIPDTATPEPAIKTATPTAEAQEELVTAPAATETPVADSAPTPESTSTPAPVATPTPPPPTASVAPTATNTPAPTPTAKPTSTPAPSPTPTITPTPAPMVPTKLEIYARGELIDQDIDQSDIKVLSVEEHTWPDRTLGCGSYVGSNPAQAVEGWILVLGNDEKTYTFHVASKDHDSNSDLPDDIIANCTDVEDREQPTINLVHDLRLHEARRAVLYREVPGGEAQPVQDIQNRELIDVIINALNMPIPIGNTGTCETSFRLDFYVLRGIESVKFFCRDDWYRVGGDQEVWDCTQGAISQELLDSVSPFFAAQPIPALPTFAPDGDVNKSSNTDNESFEGLPCQLETAN